MQNKLVSVIIPAYNEEKLIEKTLISLKRQSYRPIETIVVDNGSTDKTQRVAKKYTDRVLYLSERGTAKTRNYGARFANGEYLFFLDADTEVSKNAIRNSVKYLNKGFAGGRIKVNYKSNNQKIKLFEFIQNVGLIKVGFYTGPFIYTTKEFFQKSGGWDERIKFQSDMDLMKKISRFGELKSDAQSIAKTSARRLIQNKHYFYINSIGILTLFGVKRLPYPPVREGRKLKKVKFNSLQSLLYEKEFSFLLRKLVSFGNKNNFKDLIKNYKRYLKKLRV